MNSVQSTLLSALPGKRKTTPNGWISINAPCCHHNGHSRDTKLRGGLKIENTSWVYSCFNCGFKAGYTPGKQLTDNSKKLFRWLGIPDQTIMQLQLYCMQLSPSNNIDPVITHALETRQLPPNSEPIIKLLDDGCIDPNFLDCIEYIFSRGLELQWYNWHWCPEKSYKDRVIIPFYYNNKIVGHTGRKVTDNSRPKYLTSSQPGYVFNIDAQYHSRKYCIVTEGQFDAIAIDGIAIMHNDPSDEQISKINSLGKEIIVVPDRDAAGAKMLKAAANNNWNVSMPPWEPDIKDVADAQQRYGRLYTLQTILHYKETNPIKIKLLQKKLENLHDKTK